MSSYNNPSEPTVQNMIMCFRVPELQSLLSFAGKNKSGRKQDLVNKSMQLLQSNTGNKTQIHTKVRDLYHRRIPQIPKSEHMVDSKMERYDPQEPTSGNSYQDFHLGFKPLPFYQQEEQLHAPAKLAPSGKSFDGRSVPCNKMKVTFTIHSSHLHLLDCSKRRPFSGQYSQRNSAQVQLRFNMLDDRPKHPDRLPPHINIRLNDQTVLLPPMAPQTKAGDDPRHFNRPINLTNQCMKPGRNKLCIKWTPNSESYAFVINIVKQQSVEDLLSKLEKRGLRPVHEARMDIKSMLHEDADAEISTMCLRVSLLCPLGKMRMITPARPRTCTHLQCFDVNFFLKMNENKPTWTCPVCDKPAEFDDIQIDEYFSQILRQCREDEIEFNEDGSWNSTSIKKAETYVIGSSKSYDNALDLSWTQVNQGRKEEKKPQPEVIDLTCDTSDEEDVPITPLPDNIHYNSGQVDLVASPPVSSSMGSISSRSSASTPYPPSMVHNSQWTSDEQLMTPPLPQTPKSSSHPYHVAPLRCSPRRDRLRYSPISSPYRSSSSSRPAVETPPAPLPIHEVNSIINNSTISSSNHLDVDVDSAAAAMSNNVAVSMNQAAASVVSGMNGGIYATGSPSLPSLHSQLSLNHLGNAAFAAALCQQFGPPSGFPGLSEHANGYRQRHIYEYFMPHPPSAVSSGLPSPHSAYQQHSAAAASAALVSASSQLHQRTAVAAAAMSAAAAGRNPYSMGFFPPDVLGHHNPNSGTGLQPHSSNSTSLSSSVVNPLMSSRSPGDRSDPTSTGNIIPID